MAPPHRQKVGVRADIRAVGGYALVCVAIGAAVAALLVALVDGADPGSGVSLPPVRQTQLVKAVQFSGCKLRRTEAARPRDETPEPAGARPGFYDEALPGALLDVALRRGVIVISYRRGIDHARVEQLRSLQTVVPTGTIVAPGGAASRYEVAVAAYRRLLECAEFTDAAIDAIRLFRGRYIGTGPDR